MGKLIFKRLLDLATSDCGLHSAHYCISNLSHMKRKIFLFYTPRNYLWQVQYDLRKDVELRDAQACHGIPHPEAVIEDVSDLVCSGFGVCRRVLGIAKDLC